MKFEMRFARRTHRFVETHLDPASRLGEVVSGLIMVLSMTPTTGFIVDDGPDGVRQLLPAAIGCSVARGTID